MAINPANITTIRVGQLPSGSLSLTSKIAIENGTDLYQTDMQGLVNFLNIHLGARQFQILEFWVTQTYIDDNFDVTGLGINLCEGLAICNGQNGTPPMDGLVSIGYGTNYNIIGNFGGSKDAVVVEHKHREKISTGAGSQQGVVGDPTSSGSAITYVETETVGVSGANKNMQPYIVLLKCMKL
mgnify:CR=1 FL=1